MNAHVAQPFRAILNGFAPAIATPEPCGYCEEAAPATATLDGSPACAKCATMCGHCAEFAPAHTTDCPQHPAQIEEAARLDQMERDQRSEDAVRGYSLKLSGDYGVRRAR